MPPFVAKAANAAGTELELPAKVQELLAGQTPSSILPHDPLGSTQVPLTLGKHCISGVAQLTWIVHVTRHVDRHATDECCDSGPDGELPEALQRLEPQILEMVCSEILEGGSGCTVSWDDIAGQDRAKRLVQELVVWPMLNPHLFKVLGNSPSAHRVMTLPCLRIVDIESAYASQRANYPSRSLSEGSTARTPTQTLRTYNQMQRKPGRLCEGSYLACRGPGRLPRGCCCSGRQAQGRP